MTTQLTLNLMSSLLCLIVISIHTTVNAEEFAVSCEDIPGNADRLQCFDQQAKVNSTTVTNTVLDERLIQEASSLTNSFSFTAHRPTYILPLAYMDRTNTTPFATVDPLLNDASSMDNLEAKFQISFRVPIYKDWLIKNSQIWFAYTQLSLWQVYNSKESSPFRETNHEPEIFWSFLMNQSLGEIKLTHLAVGINHQSNGRSDPLSRSWNRITLDSIWTYQHWLLDLRAWYRLPDTQGDDDNPDIEDYMGYFDLRIGHKKQEHQLSTLFRGNSHDGKLRAYYEVGYSFSINRKFRGYIQFVSGYGETLIDYNYRNQRISLGIMLNDWF